MNERQKKNGILNVFYGFINKMFTIGFGMLIPQIIMTHLGSDMNGLLSTITQVYGCMTILEAGVGFATSQALYEPIAINEKQKINGILSATNIYYKRIGLAYLGLVVTISYFFPFIGESPLTVWETRFLVFLTGIGGVITFFFQGKFILLIEAEGKSYIVHNITTVSTIITHLIRVILIVNNFHIITVQCCVLFIQLCVMCYYKKIEKSYGWLNFAEKPDYKAVEKKNNVLLHRICWFVFSNTDIILVSVYLNYTYASIYSIYSLVTSTVYSLLTLVWTSTVFYWGQSYNCGKASFYEENLQFQKLFYAVIFCGNSILVLMLRPFIVVYTKNVTDANYIDPLLMILFVIVYILQGIRVPNISLTEISGDFKETQHQAIIESILNLGFSLILVQYLGIYGILIGTIIAVLYRDIALIQYSSANILFKSAGKIYKCCLWNLFLAVLSVACGRLFIKNCSGWINLILMGVYITALVLSIFILGNYRLIAKYLLRKHKK